jgi:hypothetical protein
MNISAIEHASPSPQFNDSHHDVPLYDEFGRKIKNKDKKGKSNKKGTESQLELSHVNQHFGEATYEEPPFEDDQSLILDQSQVFEQSYLDQSQQLEQSYQEVSYEQHDSHHDMPLYDEFGRKIKYPVQQQEAQAEHQYTEEEILRWQYEQQQLAAPQQEHGVSHSAADTSALDESLTKEKIIHFCTLCQNSIPFNNLFNIHSIFGKSL